MAKLTSNGSTDSNDSSCTNALAQVECTVLAGAAAAAAAQQDSTPVTASSCSPHQAAAASTAAAVSEVPTGFVETLFPTGPGRTGLAAHAAVTKDTGATGNEPFQASAIASVNVDATPAKAAETVAAPATMNSGSGSSAAVQPVTPISAAGATQEQQPLATAAGSPAVAEKDIAKWIQLPRHGPKGRAARAPPSAEEPWQVYIVHAVLYMLCPYCTVPCHSMTVLCCAVLCCAVPCCAVLCCAVLCCAVLCRAVPSCAVLCCAVPSCAVLCCMMLCHSFLHS